MSRRHRLEHRRRPAAAPVLAAVFFAGGSLCLGVAAANQVSAPPPAASSAEPVADVPTDTQDPSRVLPRPLAGKPAPRETVEAAPRVIDRAAPPVHLSIPSLDIETDLPTLGLDDRGVLEVPTDPDVAGWFADGTAPGDPGAAVVTGHVDSTEGPGVFYALGALEPGAEIVVDRQDGSTATFTVQEVGSYPKDELPTVQVYSSVEPTLRLVTCGGTWDEEINHYRDNVVAYADLTATG